MGDTRPHKQVEAPSSGAGRRQFLRALLQDVRALERMLKEGRFETGAARIGAEQEMFLVDKAFSPAPGALRMLDKLQDPHFTTELGLFQLEMNAEPQTLAGKGIARLEQQLTGLFEKTRHAAAELDLIPVLMGILPTIRKQELGLDNMVPSPRYRALNQAIYDLRGGPFEFSIKGVDELAIKHDSVMVEACNCSFQVHLQVAPDDFARLYNLAQALAGPLLAVATNSPLLFGKRLWAETRIALFQQAVDTRKSGALRDSLSRVTFGSRWVHSSVLEIHKEDIVRFRTLVGSDLDENPLEKLDRGEIPQLKALRLHNGTVYRWNRACYGILDGKPHLRIENRVLPSGPTIADEMANAALWLGLMSELGQTIPDVTKLMDFDQAQANFYAAARDGLAAQFVWLEGEETSAPKLVLDKLLPLAEAGLRRAGVDADDIGRYLGIVDNRVRSGRTGSRWILSSFAEMKKGKPGERLNALVAATVHRQGTGRTVAEWERARLDEAAIDKHNYLRVDQYMTTDIFSVHADDPVDLVANLMGWERIRHVPVEDSDHRLIGLISYRSVLRFLTSDRAQKTADTPVSEIMKTDVVTITPSTPTLEAIGLLRRFRIGCLPVVAEGKLVGIITEENFMDIAADLLEKRLNG
jgi:CBS domain-containing protein